MKLYYVCKESDYVNIITQGLKVTKISLLDNKSLNEVKRTFSRWNGIGIWLFYNVDYNLLKRLSLYLWHREDKIFPCYLVECDINPRNLLGYNKIDTLKFSYTLEVSQGNYPDCVCLKDIDSDICLVDIPKESMKIVNYIHIKVTQYNSIKANQYYHYIPDEWWKNCQTVGKLNPYYITNNQVKEGLDLIQHSYKGIRIWSGHIITMKAAVDYFIWKKIIGMFTKGHLIELHNINTEDFLAGKIKSIGRDWVFSHSLTLGSNILHKDQEFDTYLKPVDMKNIKHIGTIEEVIEDTCISNKTIMFYRNAIMNYYNENVL